MADAKPTVGTAKDEALLEQLDDGWGDASSPKPPRAVEAARDPEGVAELDAGWDDEDDEDDEDDVDVPGAPRKSAEEKAEARKRKAQRKAERRQTRAAEARAKQKARKKSRARGDAPASVRGDAAPSSREARAAVAPAREPEDAVEDEAPAPSKKLSRTARRAAKARKRAVPWRTVAIGFVVFVSLAALAAVLWR